MKKSKKKESPKDKWTTGGKKLGNTLVDVKDEKKEEKKEEKEEKLVDREVDQEEHMMKILEHMMNQQRGNQNGPKIERERSAVLTLYRNGFCINNGSFLSFDDPNNKKMMEEINSGTVPQQIREIIGPAMSYSFQLDPRDENYSPPKVPFKAFSTTGGRTLGVNKSDKIEEKKRRKS